MRTLTYRGAVLMSPNHILTAELSELVGITSIGIKSLFNQLRSSNTGPQATAIRTVHNMLCA